MEETRSARERILEVVKNGERLVPVLVPEWGLEIWVQRLTWPERIAFRERHGDIASIPDTDQEGRVRWMVRYVIGVALDRSGLPIFSPEDEATLYHDAQSTAIERIAMAALRLNGVRQEDLAELGKGSPPTLNGASRSGSAATSG